ncbi:GSCOCG00012490001-RA-CDS [Cotesia congregata]|nr:GSCOCG00012490001-RA-CDS [Cotesia congregata]
MVALTCFQWLVFHILVVTIFAGLPEDDYELKANDLTTKMRAISKDLDQQLQNIMASQAVNFTSVNTTGLPYNATTKFNPKGMGQLYNVTNIFMNIIQSKQAYPAGMSIVL